MTTAPVKAKEGQWMEWADVFKILLGATAATLFAGLFAYFKSIGAKADKAKVEEEIKNLRLEFEKQLANQRTELVAQIDVLSRRHSLWEQKAERLATREMVGEMKLDLQRLEDKFEGHFKDMIDKIMKPLEQKK